MRVTIRTRSAAARKALQASRRELRGDMLDIAEDHGRTRVLPTARRLGPSIAATSLVVRRTKTTVRLTTSARGMNRRIIGYLNFGGSIRSTIRPKRGRALRLPDGRFVAYVRTPRQFAGKHFMERARDQHLRELRRRYKRDLPGIIQRRLDA